jgi:hypothetical protein
MPCATVSPYTSTLVRGGRRSAGGEFPAFMDLDPFPRSAAPVAERPTALFVGVLERYKNVDGLAEIWRRAAPRDSRGTLQLSVVGRWTPLRRASCFVSIADNMVAEAADGGGGHCDGQRDAAPPTVTLGGDGTRRGRGPPPRTPGCREPRGGYPRPGRCTASTGSSFDPEDHAGFAARSRACSPIRWMAERLASAARLTGERLVASPAAYAASVRELVRAPTTREQAARPLRRPTRYVLPLPLAAKEIRRARPGGWTTRAGKRGGRSTLLGQVRARPAGRPRPLDGVLFYVLLPGRIARAIRTTRPDVIVAGIPHVAAAALLGGRLAGRNRRGSSLRCTATGARDAACTGLRHAVSSRPSPTRSTLWRSACGGRACPLPLYGRPRRDRRGRPPDAAFATYSDLSAFTGARGRCPNGRPRCSSVVLERYKGIDAWRPRGRAFAEAVRRRGSSSWVVAPGRSSWRSSAWSTSSSWRPRGSRRVMDDSWVLVLPSRYEGRLGRARESRASRAAAAWWARSRRRDPRARPRTEREGLLVRARRPRRAWAIALDPGCSPTGGSPKRWAAMPVRGRFEDWRFDARSSSRRHVRAPS